MALFRTRPAVRLRTPPTVVPGEEIELAVLLDAKSPVEIDGCDLRIEAFERHDETVTPAIQPLGARLCERRALPVGTTTLSCRLRLPESAPRSRSGPGTHVTYEVRVHASVPWWPDTRASFVLEVGAAPTQPVEGTPRVAVSDAAGPVSGAPYAELAIGSDVVEMGGVVDGRLALRAAPGAKRNVSLVAYERRGAGAPSRVGTWTIPVAAPTHGDSASFAFRIPDEASPSAKGRFTLEYWLTGEARGTLGRIVSASVPLTVVERGRGRRASRVVAPHVGEDRLQELFVACGTSEGAVVEPGPTLVVRRDGVEARITRELAHDGTRLAVVARYPSLALDLAIDEPLLPALAPRRRGLAQRAGLTSRCTVSARDDAQVAAYLGRLATPLERASGISMTDTELRYAIRTPANDAMRIARVVRECRAVVEHLASPPPLPRALRDAEGAWLALAAELGATLRTGDAHIEAETADAHVEITTLFRDDGEPSGTRISVRPTRELRLDAPVERSPSTRPKQGPEARGEASPELPGGAGWPAEARSALERLARHGHVVASSHEITVGIDAPLGPTVPAARAREIVDAALRLAVALRPTQGPFR